MGPTYPDHGLLFVYPDGRPLHPDTLTARFNRLVDRAGLPPIRLHDYADIRIMPTSLLKPWDLSSYPSERVCPCTRAGGGAR